MLFPIRNLTIKVTVVLPIAVLTKEGTPSIVHHKRAGNHSSKATIEVDDCFEARRFKLYGVVITRLDVLEI